MDIPKALPVAVIAILGTGVGFAHGSTPLMNPVTTSTNQGMTTPNERLILREDSDDVVAIKEEIADLRARMVALAKSSDPDRASDIAAIKERIADLRARLRTFAGEGSGLDRKADIAAIKEKIADLRARMVALAKSSDPDRASDIAAIKERISDLRARLRALNSRSQHVVEGEDRDFRDHESFEASLHHDGDDRIRGLEREDFEHYAHREAARDIMRASRQRVASIYAPSHHAGYHVRMRRHAR